MDKLFRFSDYDIFAYLGVGLVAIAVFDLTFSTHYVVGADWSVADVAMLAIVSYIVGHIVAGLASWVLERVFLHKWIGRPLAVLLDRDVPSNWVGRAVRYLLPRYYLRASPDIIRKVTAKTGAGADLDDIFWAGHDAAKRVPATAARLDSFLRLYGFSRNIAFVGFVGAAGFLIAAVIAWVWGDPHIGNQGLLRAAIALLVGLSMLVRYLKFHRHYALEILTSLAHQRDPK